MVNMMTAQWHPQLVLIMVLGLVCSGCVSTGADTDTFLEKVAEEQQNIESLAYTETLTFHLGDKTRNIEYDVLLKKPDKFRKIERSGSDVRSEIVSNGSIVWIYDPEKNTVFIRNLTPSEKIPEPVAYALLTDNISEKYMIKNQEMESLNSTQAYKVKLIPLQPNSENVRECLLWIDSDNLTPLKLQSWDKGDPLLTLEYRNYSMNCVINDDEFTFTIPDGASVVYA